VPFALDAFLAALKQRLLAKSHAVIAVAEGAGQDLLAADANERDPSGNVKLKNIGRFLRERIEAFFKAEGIPVVIRYFDPSYQVRSRAANCEDALLLRPLRRATPSTPRWRARRASSSASSASVPEFAPQYLRGISRPCADPAHCANHCIRMRHSKEWLSELIGERMRPACTPKPPRLGKRAPAASRVGSVATGARSRHASPTLTTRGITFVIRSQSSRASERR
jgi:hypothetical protein